MPAPHDEPAPDPAEEQRQLQAIVARSEAQFAEAKRYLCEAEDAIRRSRELLDRLPNKSPPGPAQGRHADAL
jgi:hypothetical protein